MDLRYLSYRGGISLDVDFTLSGRSRLLAGGELFYDYQPESLAQVQAAPEAIASLHCPAPIGDNPCPIVVTHSSNRLTTGLFVSAQTRFRERLALSAGSRLQVYGGKRALDPVVILEGAAVVSLTSDADLKLGFSEGFRPPSLRKTDGGPNFWHGLPNLRIERSRAVQAEFNARLLVDHRAIRQLALRVDYSHTWVNDFIAVANNQFLNRSTLGIHSVEFLARLQLKAGHGASLGYTFSDVSANDVGQLRSMPAQWLTHQGLFQLIKGRLLLSTNLATWALSKTPTTFRGVRRGKSTWAV